MRRSVSFAALCALAAVLAGCSSEPTSTADRTPGAAAAQGPTPEAGAGPASTVRPDAEEVAAAATPLGNPLTFTPPAGWVTEEPSSGMRKAQYRLPGAAEDGAEDAELVVYYFGPSSGGTVEANVERWASQFSQPDGSDTMDRVTFSERRVRGLPVHEVAISGTYVAETSPGSGERVDRPGWSMLAAIVESDHGPYYLKLTGPEATVKARSGEFRALVSELR